MEDMELLTLNSTAAETIVKEIHPNAELVEHVSRENRKEWTVRDKRTRQILGATSITTPERAWVYAAMKVRQS